MVFRQGYALVIGVGAYHYAPQRNVPVTVGDAEAVAQVLRDPLRCGYPTEQVVVLTNAQASRPAILEGLDRLAGRLAESDTLFVFYAGHGEYDDAGAYYLTTHDTQLRGRKVVRETAVRQDELLQRLRAIKAQRIILVLNACHSGALVPSLGQIEEETGNAVPQNLAGALLGTGQGRVVITACGEDQKAYFQRDAPTTIFTRQLIECLNGRGVPNRKGAISVLDLYATVYDTVSTSVQRTYRLDQDPQLTVSKLSGNLPVALFRGSQQLGALGAEDQIDLATIPGAVRVVDGAEARRLYEQVVNVAGGATSSRGAAISFGSGNQYGDLTFGDIAGGSIYKNTYGDTINVGDISGSKGVAIGRGANAASGADTRHTYFEAQGQGTNQAVTLQRVLSELQTARKQAQGAGVTQMGRELERIAEDIQLAAESEGEQNASFRGRLLRRAQRDLEELVGQNDRLRPLLELILQVQQL